MRSLIRLSALVAVAAISACADENPPTSPTTAQLSTTRPATSVADALADGPRASGKPAELPAFTKVFMALSPTYTEVPFSYTVDVRAACPAGSFPIGGSVQVAHYMRSQYISVVDAFMDGANGWTVQVRNTHNFDVPITVRGRAICIQ